MTKEDFLAESKQAAIDAGHIWPGYAAAETALESAWGSSRLATQGNNLFGRKQSNPPVFDTLDLPTKEYESGSWITTMAHWVKYPALSDCFADRMVILKRLAPFYSHYARALSAPDGETFVREVSQTWSTDPQRAQKVLDIYAAHEDILGDAATAATEA